MLNEFSRTELLFGSDGMEKLKACRVAVFGVGGVGGYAVEALARSGIGTLDLIDNDTVSLTNLNRQIIALHSTIGKLKIIAAKERILDICPDIKVNTFPCFYMPDTSSQFDFKNYDYIIDAIDTVTGKLEIIKNAQEAGTPVISSMGAGNKLDPAAFRVADIYQTQVCPLARTIRRECRKLGIQKLKVVYSEEQPAVLKSVSEENSQNHKPVPASNAFVPSVAGLIIAGEVIKDLLKQQ